MDFQSAMETFAEAWVAANAGPQSQALALTRAANAAAAAAAASANAAAAAAAQGIKPAGTASLAELALKKEHSLSPPHSIGSGSSATPGAASATNIDEGGGSAVTAANYRRRPSLQGVQDKLAQLQMQHQQQHQQQQQHLQQQQQQHQQQLHEQHQQQLREQLAAHDEARSPHFGNLAASLAVGAANTAIVRSRSTDANTSPNANTHMGADNERHISSTPSSQNASLAVTPKMMERDERAGSGNGGVVSANPGLVGSISCLPPAALNAVASSMASGVAGSLHSGVAGVPTQAEQLLSSTPSALESRAREFDPAKVNSKSLPLHCVVESVHSLQASLAIDSRSPWKRRTNIETDSYVIMAAATPWSELVQTALQRLGYSQEAVNTARGSIMIKNWKPIPLEMISDNPVVPVSDIIGELTSVITLRIVILRSKPSTFGEIKDKLLKLLVLQSHTVLRSTGCPLDEMTLSQICRTSYQNPYSFPAGEISDELRRKFDQWWSQQLTPQSSITPKMLPFLTAPSSVPNEMDFPVGSAAVAAAAAAAAAAQAGLHAASGGGNMPGSNIPGLNASRDSLLMNDATHHGPQGAAAAHHPNMLVHPAMHPSMHHHHHHPHSQYPNQKTRMRTSFDPEMELPKLQKWFQENPHPSRQQIQTYVVQLNALESRRGRKPLDVNNVVYWFKNARAAQKRAEMRGGLAALGHPGLNGFMLNQHGQLGQSSSSSGGSQQMSSSNINLAMSHDYLKSPLSLKSEDVDTMSQHSDDMDEDNSRPGSPQLPLSLTTHERNRNSPLEGAEGNMDLGDSRRDNCSAEGAFKDETMLNGSLNQSLRSCSRSYTEEEAQAQTKPNDAQTDDQHGDNSNEDTANEQQNETENNNSNNNNNANNLNNNNISSSNNNNSTINNNEQSCDAVNTQPQAHSSPKISSPKEEDDDLDLEDDDDDNENDVSQLDEYRSLSPDLANAMAQRKDLPFPMVPNSMFSQSFMYMSHYIPGFGQAAANHPHAHHAAAAAAAAGMPPNALMNPSGLNLSSMSNEERRKRNRTFIDPVTEVPKLEQWFALNTHPSHNLILKYTEDLNTMPYRQKFPRLESKNVQFWFKNRRAKCKRLKMSLYDSSQLQGLNSFVSKYEERD
ncbi:uncharacterized protein LOC126755644 isoform X1 [Bactrocera neohumeralis]|uniref:uncharacterized protein LOC126755644 isoform X1 n=1 Tax=Bactrocera neohumeralis TaxID=98809 RepID=UPI002165185A|nr:uncharacterized protein LOC126755644 isoform X1 [Bactrocera neohumeralis]